MSPSNQNSIIVGRLREDTKVFGLRDAFAFGRTLGEIKQNIFFDALNQHLVLVFGKKGFGKSYTMGMLSEGLQSIEDKKEIAVILIDTMATFAGLREQAEENEEILKQFELTPQAFDAKIYMPPGYIELLDEVGLKEKMLSSGFTEQITVRPGDLEVFDWCQVFNIERNAPGGLLLEKTVRVLRKRAGRGFSINDLIKEIEILGNRENYQANTIEAVKNRLSSSEEWGIFDPESMLLEKIAVGGSISIVDLSYMSHISAGWSIRGMIVALLARQILRRRMLADRVERGEFGKLDVQTSNRLRYPKVWMMIDEAHQFLPSHGTVISSNPLIEWVRQGRKPGLSLVLATQRPSRLHEDAISQGDIVISHTLTAKADLASLNALNQSWMKSSIEKLVARMPKDKGNAIVFDDTNKEILVVKARMRQSKEEGSTATAMPYDEYRRLKREQEKATLIKELGFDE